MALAVLTLLCAEPAWASPTRPLVGMEALYGPVRPMEVEEVRQAVWMDAVAQTDAQSRSDAFTGATWRSVVIVAIIAAAVVIIVIERSDDDTLVVINEE